MDDTRHYTVQIKGTAYRFKPFAADDLERVQTLSLMGAGTEMIKAAMDMTSTSLGEDQWAAIIARVQAKELVITDIVSAMKRVAERQGKEPKGAPVGGGLDVASTELRPVE